MVHHQYLDMNVTENEKRGVYFIMKNYSFEAAAPEIMMLTLQF